MQNSRRFVGLATRHRRAGAKALVPRGKLGMPGTPVYVRKTVIHIRQGAADGDHAQVKIACRQSGRLRFQRGLHGTHLQRESVQPRRRLLFHRLVALLPEQQQGIQKAVAQRLPAFSHQTRTGLRR